MKKFFLLFLTLFLLSFDTTYCQPMTWKVVAPNIIRVVRAPIYGAIKAKGSTVLAGWRNLALSNDYGKTWTTLPQPFVGLSDYISGLDVFDSLNFVIITTWGEAFRTTNGGSQWTSIFNSRSTGFHVAYLGSPDKLLIMSAALSPNGNVVMTIGGSSTSFDLPDNYSSPYAIAADGSIRVLAASDANYAQFYVSSDSNTTWRSTSTAATIMPFGDINAVIADQSDPNRFVLVNENTVSRNGGNSRMFLTTNNGASWTMTYSQALGAFSDLCGNATTGCKDYFVGTQNRGILRSSDRGLTWNSIGGPVTSFDSKAISAVDDSLIFAMDTAGNIWATEPMWLQQSTPHISGYSLFSQFDISVCDSPMIGTVYLSPADCGAINISSLAMAGLDPSDFTIVSSLASPPSYPDSIKIKFTPNSPGSKNALLQLIHADGRITSVPLSTFVNGGSIMFSQSILNGFTDTIGGDVEIAIALTHSGSPENAEFTIHYDTASLDYHGVFDGSNFDHTTGHPDLRSARIRFNTVNDSVLFARFSFYPIDSSCTKITIDSMTAVSGSCLSILSTDLSAEICSPAKCGWRSLAQFVRLGRMPQLSVSPNPSSGNFILSSSESLGQVTITILNKLGVPVTAQISELTKERPATVNLEPLPSGVYFVRVSGVLSTVAVVVEK
jgi:photosystem II stability/assembly factor-like uncharacterized protein